MAEPKHVQRLPLNQGAFRPLFLFFFFFLFFFPKTLNCCEFSSWSQVTASPKLLPPGAVNEISNCFKESNWKPLWFMYNRRIKADIRPTPGNCVCCRFHSQLPPCTVSSSILWTSAFCYCFPSFDVPLRFSQWHGISLGWEFASTFGCWNNCIVKWLPSPCGLSSSNVHSAKGGIFHPARLPVWQWGKANENSCQDVTLVGPKRSTRIPCEGSVGAKRFWARSTRKK